MTSATPSGPNGTRPRRHPLARLICDLSVSVDGYVAGPKPSLKEPPGEGGEQLHEWALASMAWREAHGKSGGERNADSDVIEETIEAAGAHLMGRRMFSNGTGPWEDDPKAIGWWGDEPPFHKPVFVLTHHRREPLELTGTTFTFVTAGIEAALEQAREAAGDKDVQISGGADVAGQYLAAGLVDEFQMHVAPVMLGGGVRLFDRLGANRPGLEIVR